MPFEFIQIPANGQGNAKEELNKLLRGGRIASVRKEFVAKVAGASRSRPLSGRLALTPNAGGETPPSTNWRETRQLLSRVTPASTNWHETRQLLSRVTPPAHLPDPPLFHSVNFSFSITLS
ncbi:MAG: hypothetical protein WCL19_07120 [Verrucomicrobiota bacterium]